MITHGHVNQEWADIAFVLPAGGELHPHDRIAVLQHYGRVVIATVPEDDADEVRAIAHGSLVAAGRRHGDVDAATWHSLDPAERLALEGYWLNHSEEYRRTKDERPGMGAAWDHPDFLPPDPPGGVDLTAVAEMNHRLRGSVAIGLVMVSGPDDLAFSDDQKARVLAETQTGLSWLGWMWQLKRVRYIVDVYTPTITTPADPSAPDREKEAVWRNPAMKEMKQKEGKEGVGEFAESLRKKHSTDGAYVAFFMHYPALNFAYAEPGWPETVMQYSNGPWTPYGIDRVFAHETCHIFGAPDEYRESLCRCGGSHGYYHMPNDNCDNCDGPHEFCIMGRNWYDMCTWTPRHLGAPIWWVNGQDKIFSPVAVSEGVIYYQGTDSYIYRVKTDGKPAVRFDKEQTSATPCVVGKVIYYQGTNYRLYQVTTDGTSGGSIGEIKLMGSPVYSDGYLYYRGTDNYLYKLRIGDTEGERIANNKLLSPPAVGGGYIFYQGTNYYLYKVRIGETTGTRVGDGELLSSPFVSDGAVYFQGTNNGLYRIPFDGKVSQQLGECRTLATPFVAGGWVYHQGTDCLPWRVKTDGTGREILTGAPIRSSPVVADDVVYFEGNDLLHENHLYMINLT
ncbi:DUF5050 domain-containing protein [Catenulispora acidiphila]|uniref:DUF5050 domain-containing protein n=1 Tax=Catenulispora acidiphila TaxID=304895 RepID=UPI00117F93F0|nr:DUF5050 domain-containing protein [Catenulispora acidiphila]